MKRTPASCLLAALVLTAPACYTFEHQVGTGGTGASTTEEGAWYALWGLVKITEPDSKQLAGSAENYSVTTEFTFVDVVITFFTGWVTIHKQTVRVDK